MQNPAVVNNLQLKLLGLGRKIKVGLRIGTTTFLGGLMKFCAALLAETCENEVFISTMF